MTSATAAAQVPAIKAGDTADVELNWSMPMPSVAYSVLVSVPTSLKGRVTWQVIENELATSTVRFTASRDVTGGAVSALAYAF